MLPNTTRSGHYLHGSLPALFKGVTQDKVIYTSTPALTPTPQLFPLPWAILCDCNER